MSSGNAAAKSTGRDQGPEEGLARHEGGDRGRVKLEEPPAKSSWFLSTEEIPLKFSPEAGASAQPSWPHSCCLARASLSWTSRSQHSQ